MLILATSLLCAFLFFIQIYSFFITLLKLFINSVQYKYKIASKLFNVNVSIAKIHFASFYDTSAETILLILRIANKHLVRD